MSKLKKFVREHWDEALLILGYLIGIYFLFRYLGKI